MLGSERIETNAQSALTPLGNSQRLHSHGACLTSGEESACQRQQTQETQVGSLDREDPLEKEMAIHSSSIAWKIPWTEEPGRLQSMRLQRVGYS